LKQLWNFIFVMCALLQFWTEPAFAKSAKRELFLEWEEIPGSHGYELEFVRIQAGGVEKKPLMFKAKGTKWSGKIHPGQYRVRIRSLDERSARGEWGEPFTYWVRLPPPENLRPSDSEKIASQSSSEHQVRFEWDPVEGAGGYQIEIVGGAALKKTVSESHADVDLPVGKAYRYRVTSVLPDETEPAQDGEWRGFEVRGGRLATPEPKRPDSQFVQKLEWRGDPGAESYDIEIARKEGEQWKVLETKSGVTGTQLNLNPGYPGGTMRLAVTAVSPLREKSERAVMEFPVYHGQRTKKAIAEAKRREALESASDNFLLAVYQISNIEYYGQFQELGGTELRFEAISGTGRLGWAHFAPAARWGWMAMADMSGVIINRENYTFASAEALAMWRTYINGVYQLRIFFGGMYRQLPHVKGTTPESVTVENMSATGPTAGAQFWYPATRKLGLQVNSQMGSPVIGLQTPGGQELEGGFTFQLGVLGSYKLRENATGMLGLSLRSEELTYTPPSGEGVNTVNMGGLYLSFHLEWGF
jgi:hypothetical protein